MNRFLQHLAVTPVSQLTLADVFGALGTVLVLGGCFAEVPKLVAWLVRKGRSHAKAAR